MLGLLRRGDQATEKPSPDLLPEKSAAGPDSIRKAATSKAEVARRIIETHLSGPISLPSQAPPPAPPSAFPRSVSNSTPAAGGAGASSAPLSAAQRYASGERVGDVGRQRDTERTRGSSSGHKPSRTSAAAAASTAATAAARRSASFHKSAGLDVSAATEGSAGRTGQPRQQLQQQLAGARNRSCSGTAPLASDGQPVYGHGRGQVMHAQEGQEMASTAGRGPPNDNARDRGAAISNLPAATIMPPHMQQHQQYQQHHQQQEQQHAPGKFPAGCWQGHVAGARQQTGTSAAYILREKSRLIEQLLVSSDDESDHSRPTSSISSFPSTTSIYSNASDARSAASSSSAGLPASLVTQLYESGYVGEVSTGNSGRGLLSPAEVIHAPSAAYEAATTAAAAAGRNSAGTRSSKSEKWATPAADAGDVQQPPLTCRLAAGPAYDILVHHQHSDASDDGEDLYGDGGSDTDDDDVSMHGYMRNDVAPDSPVPPLVCRSHTVGAQGTGMILHASPVGSPEQLLGGDGGRGREGRKGRRRAAVEVDPDRKLLSGYQGREMASRDGVRPGQEADVMPMQGQQKLLQQQHMMQQQQQYQVLQQQQQQQQGMPRVRSSELLQQQMLLQQAQPQQWQEGEQYVQGQALASRPEQQLQQQHVPQPQLPQQQAPQQAPQQPKALQRIQSFSYEKTAKGIPAAATASASHGQAMGDAAMLADPRMGLSRQATVTGRTRNPIAPGSLDFDLKNTMQRSMQTSEPALPRQQSLASLPGSGPAGPSDSDCLRPVRTKSGDQLKAITSLTKAVKPAAADGDLDVLSVKQPRPVRMKSGDQVSAMAELMASSKAKQRPETGSEAEPPKRSKSNGRGATIPKDVKEKKTSRSESMPISAASNGSSTVKRHYV